MSVFPVQKMAKVTRQFRVMVKTSTQQRDRVFAIAYEEPAKAYELARTIKNPWYACQALACVGRFWPHRDFKKIIAESIQVGSLEEDPYIVAASAAWPVGALMERDLYPQAEATLLSALRTCRSISHPSSHAQATFLLFQAVKHFELSLWIAPLDALACPESRCSHWRQKRNLRDAIAMLRHGDIEEMKASGAGKQTIQLATEFLGSPNHRVAMPRAFFP